jgi:hypothetical protein
LASQGAPNRLNNQHPFTGSYRNHAFIVVRETKAFKKRDYRYKVVKLYQIGVKFRHQRPKRTATPHPIPFDGFECALAYAMVTQICDHGRIVT